MTKLLTAICVIICCIVTPQTIRAQSSNDSDNEQIIAEVDDVKIYLREYLNAVIEKEKRLGQLSQDAKLATLDELIDSALVYRDAVNKEVDKRPEIQAAINKERRRSMLQYAIETEVMQKITVTDDAAKQYYEEHRDAYEPTTVGAQVLAVFKKNKEGEDVSKEAGKLAAVFEEKLLKGEQAEALLAEHKDISGLFMLNRSFKSMVQKQFSPEDRKMYDILITLAEGQTSIIEFPKSILVIRLDLKVKSNNPFDMVKNRIITELQFAERQRLFREYISRLRQGSTVKVNHDLIK